MSRPQQPWAIVAMREIVVRLTNKAFIISTLVTLALIVGSAGVQVLIAQHGSTMKVAVTTDAGARVADSIAKSAAAEDDSAKLEVKRAADPAAAKSLVDHEDADAALLATGTGWELVSRGAPNEKLERLARQSVQAQALAANAAAAGTSVEQLTKGSTLTARALDEDKAERDAMGMVVATLFSLLFMMGALMFGIQIANSVVEEKASRVVEIIAAAVPIRQLLAGKVIGNTVMALGQILVLATAAVIGVSFTPMRSMLPRLLPSTGWFLVFFLVGFLAIACLWAVAGALASRQEDLQSTTTPMTGLIMFAYLAGFLATGTWAAVLSYVPIVSTVLMPTRVFRGEASWWEAVIALLISLAFAVVAVIFSEKLYRRSLLQTQGVLSIRKALALQD